MDETKDTPKDTFICLMQRKDHKSWSVVISNKSLKKIEDHLEKQTGPDVGQIRIFKVDGAAGTISMNE